MGPQTHLEIAVTHQGLHCPASWHLGCSMCISRFLRLGVSAWLSLLKKRRISKPESSGCLGAPAHGRAACSASLPPPRHREEELAHLVQRGAHRASWMVVPNTPPRSSEWSMCAYARVHTHTPQPFSERGCLVSAQWQFVRRLCPWPRLHGS